MSSGNIAFELQNTEFPIPSTTPVQIINVQDATYGKACVFMYVKGAPGTYAVASSAAGPTAYAKGCLAIDTANGAIFVNSNATAPSWSAQV